MAGALAIAGQGVGASATLDIERLEASLVRVIVNQEEGLGLGSGFVLNAAGQIATNHHVVEDRQHIAVHLSGGGDMHLARTVWSSAELDLAVIEAEGGHWIPMPTATRIPKKGAPVYALGFPGVADALSTHGVALDATLTDGVLSRAFRGAWRSRELQILQHSADINPGNSGGPLLDECGRVIGVNTLKAAFKIADADGNLRTVSTASGLFWAASVQELTAALDQQSIRYLSDPAACPSAGLAPSIPSAGGGVGRRGDAAADTPWAVFASLLLVALVIATALLTWQVRRQGLRLATVLMPLSRGRDDASASAADSLEGGLALMGERTDGSPIRVALPAADLTASPHGIVLGRHPMLADTTIDSLAVSRRHARFECRAGRFTVQDLNSANGLRLNGQALKPYRPQRVREGDRIVLGDLELRVSAL